MEYKMLVVDDEEAVTSTLNTIFLDKGYKVQIANSGNKAKDIIDEAPLDLILLDIEMPGLSGLEVLKYVKSKYPDTKVIIVTAYDEYEKQAKKLNCDAFITKPFALGKLASTIEALLYKKDYQEVKERSLGATFYSASKGNPLADILLIEPIEQIAKSVSDFLMNHQKSGGYYRVYPVEGKDKALIVQETLYTSIAMVDLRTTYNPAELIESLVKAEHPPKDFIFYFKQDVPKGQDKLKKVKAKQWNGNPFDEKSLKGLAEIIKSAALEHGLIKE
jgi:YesN/AraC family two-component response regulator